MNNLVYSNEIFRAICTEWFKYTAEQPMNDRGGILLEDFTEIFNRADRQFDPKPKKPLIEDHTEEYLEKLGYYDDKKAPSSDEIKNSDEYEEVVETASVTTEAPTDDDNVQQADDVKKIQNHIKAADDIQPKKCSRCGKEFISQSKRQRICPDCRKEEQKNATKKYLAKKKQQADDHGIGQAVKDILALGDD